jgi:Protein of unknown function (DUF2924)
MKTGSLSRKGRKSSLVGPNGAQGLQGEISQLRTLDIAGVREKWAALFGFNPSPLLGRPFMIGSISYRIQEKRFGGLKPSIQRLLDQVSEAAPGGALPRLPRSRASAGTVLIREWRGVRHRVTVLDDAVVYRGQRYQSLSEVARIITGAHWSGPRFFGLGRRTKEAADG